MPISYGELLKELRKAKGLSQTEFAAQICVHPVTMSRYETGKSTPSPSEFITIMQLLGESSLEYTSVFLDEKERYGYNNLVMLRRAIRDRRYSEAKMLISKIGDKAPFDSGIYLQFLIYAKVVTDESISHKAALDRLFDAIRITKKDFDISNVKRYLLSYNEITIIGSIGYRLSCLDEQIAAIDLLKSLKESMDRNYNDENEKANTYPILLYNLSTFLGKAEQYDESLELCEAAKKSAIKYNKMKIIPYIHYNIASCLRAMGKEDWQTPLKLAYYSALAMDDEYFANIVKDDAKESFGIELIL